jgi:hypothetical protein
MPQEALSRTKFTGLTPARRQQVLGAVARAVRAALGHPTPLHLPPYPDSVLEIDRHIDQLVRIVRQSESSSRAARIMKHSCSACPHQFPSRHCPLRPRGGCVLYRCAGPIAQAIAAALDEQDAEGKYASC